MSEILSDDKQRYHFIDLYRCVIIILMLEGHVVRALLKPEFQQSTLFILHELFHGITAPAFLFGAGLTFVISTRKRWREYHHWAQPLARRIGKFLFIIAIGLAIHMPFLSIRKIILEATTQDYLQLFQCDVLICIGLGLMSLHALVFFFKHEEHFYGLVLATVVIVCFITPLIWDVDFLTIFPPAIAQLFNTIDGSQFPLFPYVGFLFGGVIVSWEFLVAVGKKQETLFMKRLFKIGIGLILGGVLFDAIPIQIYPTYNFWYTSPNYFIIRIGALLILVALSWILTHKYQHVKKIFLVCGRESLFFYVLHLPILYGSVINSTFNLTVFYGLKLDVLDTFVVVVVLTILFVTLSYFWNMLKTKQNHVYRFVQLVLTASFLYAAFTVDY